MKSLINRSNMKCMSFGDSTSSRIEDELKVVS